jgi:glycerol-3-phosphate acyltransferase PlsY
MLLQIIAGCVASYFLGSISFSYIIARMVKGVDLRIVGEGNVGARNVFHVVGKKYGVLAGVLDFSKGIAAYFVGLLLGLSPMWIWLCGLFVVLGHNFPVFLKGRGGKGMACAFGFLLGMEPLVALISGAIIFLLYFPTKNFHLAVSIGMGSLPILWKFFAGRSWLDTLFCICFLFVLGLKRIIDEPHMKKVRESSGW